MIIIENEALYNYHPDFSQYSLIKQAMINFDKIIPTTTTTTTTTTTPQCVLRVVNKDWSIATSELTREFRKIFTVLNMANANKFGGGYTSGAAAQEENMFRTTNVLTYDADVDSSGRYSQTMTNLINGQNYEVLLDIDNPRIIIRNSEPNYELLSKDEYTPFYELRAAAINTKHETFSIDECRKRITAQINTLKKNKIQYVILSAFGCGAFANPPDIVSRIYKEVIDENKQFFKVIIFTIFNPKGGPDRNFDIFNTVLLS